MTQQTAPGVLQSLSAELSAAVAQAACSVVRVDDGSRLTATGVVWSDDGVILTTSHGVGRDEEVFVELADGTRLPAQVAGRDPDADLAILKVTASGLTSIGRAGADDAQVGHLVLALGRPGAYGLQATLGIISARIEVQTEGRPEHLLSTDADLYPGFSGGPLVDVSGRMVGLINLNYGRGQGVALGVPILEAVVPALLSQGTVARGYLGVSTQSVPLPETLRSALGLTQERGLLVVQVQAGGPAETAGLLLGDLLLGVDGQTVEDVDALRRRLRSLAAGQAVALDLARAGQKQALNVTLGKQE